MKKMAYDGVWHRWMAPVIILFALFVIAGYSPPIDEMCPPTPESTMIAFLLIAVVGVWSWLSDHEENAEEDEMIE